METMFIQLSDGTILNLAQVVSIPKNNNRDTTSYWTPVTMSNGQTCQISIPDGNRIRAFLSSRLVMGPH